MPVPAYYKGVGITIAMISIIGFAGASVAAGLLLSRSYYEQGRQDVCLQHYSTTSSCVSSCSASSCYCPSSGIPNYCVSTNPYSQAFYGCGSLEDCCSGCAAAAYYHAFYIGGFAAVAFGALCFCLMAFATYVFLLAPSGLFFLLLASRGPKLNAGFPPNLRIHVPLTSDNELLERYMREQPVGNCGAKSTYCYQENQFAGVLPWQVFLPAGFRSYSRAAVRARKRPWVIDNNYAFLEVWGWAILLNNAEALRLAVQTPEIKESMYMAGGDRLVALWAAAANSGSVIDEAVRLKLVKPGQLPDESEAWTEKKLAIPYYNIHAARSTALVLCILFNFFALILPRRQLIRMVTKAVIFGEHPLLVAARRGHVAAASALMAKLLVDPNKPHDVRGNTALHIAAERSDSALFTVLLEFGADPAVTNFADQVATDVCHPAHCDTLNDLIALARGQHHSRPVAQGANEAASVRGYPAQAQAPPSFRSQEYEMSTAWRPDQARSTTGLPELAAASAPSSQCAWYGTVHPEPAAASAAAWNSNVSLLVAQTDAPFASLNPRDDNQLGASLNLRDDNQRPLGGSPTASPTTAPSMSSSASGLGATLRPSKPLSMWATDDVCTWLASCGMQHLKPIFKEEAIQGAVLMFLTDEDLAGLGVTAEADRARLLAARDDLAHIPWAGDSDDSDD